MQTARNLLPDIPPLSFGTPAVQETLRKTIVAVIYNPENRTYLCQYWPEYSGLICLLSGGIEEGESQLAALEREIKEETGYRSFMIDGALGGVIYTHFYKAKTDEHFIKEIYPFFVTLQSLAQEEPTLEEDEKFQNLFKNYDEIIRMMEAYEQVSGSTLEDHKEILRRGNDYVRASRRKI